MKLTTVGGALMRASSVTLALAVGSRLGTSATLSLMPVTTVQLQLQLDDDLVHGIRELAAARGEAQDAVVAQALASFLGFSALDDAHALGGLPQDEADRLAVDEVRAVRRAARDARA